MKKLLLIFAFVPVLLFSQTRKQRKAIEAQRKADEKVINNLKSHVHFFETNASNSAAASQNGELAVNYISDQFKAIGLEPKGTNGYKQPFKIDEGKQIGPGTYLKVNGTLLAAKKDYFPLAFSASKSVSGMPAMALKEKGVPWFIDIKDWLDDDTVKANVELTKTVQKEAGRAALKGATALFLYNSSNLTDNIHFNNRDKTSPSAIPVIYITPAGYSKYFIDQSQVLDIELNVAFNEIIKNANNVTGYINNGATTNIIIATAYSNVPAAENEAGMEKTQKPEDNVSGTSLLIELARMLFASKAKNNNYTFIAYTGEDTLSPESKWLNSANTLNANYIINLDKVGRYDENKKLLIENYGAAPEWIQTILPFAGNSLEVHFDTSSLQPVHSYPVKVPVLNFTTTNGENKKVISDNGAINYEGELRIARFIYQLIEATDSKGKLAFSADNESRASGQVTSSILNNRR